MKIQVSVLTNVVMLVQQTFSKLWSSWTNIKPKGIGIIVSTFCRNFYLFGFQRKIIMDVLNCWRRRKVHLSKIAKARNRGCGKHLRQIDFSSSLISLHRHFLLLCPCIKQRYLKKTPTTDSSFEMKFSIYLLFASKWRKAPKSFIPPRTFFSKNKS